MCCELRIVLDTLQDVLTVTPMCSRFFQINNQQHIGTPVKGRGLPYRFVGKAESVFRRKVFFQRTWSCLRGCCMGGFGVLGGSDGQTTDVMPVCLLLAPSKLSKELNLFY